LDLPPIQIRTLTDIDLSIYVFLLDKGYALPWCSTDTDFHTKTTMMKDEHSPGRYSNYLTIVVTVTIKELQINMHLFFIVDEIYSIGG
jgi:hypothetical protein